VWVWSDCCTCGVDAAVSRHWVRLSETMEKDGKLHKRVAALDERLATLAQNEVKY
jgi:hypothetical protein